MSVIATAFNPPDSEYARAKTANRMHPYIASRPVNELIARAPSHKTVVRLINT